MPLYEFRCPRGHDFEKFYRSIGSAQAEEKCPECGAMAERLISAAGLVFKGSGFYITDYGKDGKKQQTAAADAAKAKPADSVTSEKKAESKPAVESKPSTPAKTTE